MTDKCGGCMGPPTLGDCRGRVDDPLMWEGWGLQSREAGGLGEGGSGGGELSCCSCAFLFSRV